MTYDGMDAEGFGYAGVEVGQVFEGLVGGWEGEVCSAEFGGEFCFGGGGFEEVVEEGFNYYCEGVGAA